MVARTRRSRSKRPAEFIQKPRGAIHGRVQRAGPERFAIVSVDCAKARSKWMLCDFYGNIKIAPEFVGHNRVELAALISRIRAAMQQHRFTDIIIAVERTGRYHHPIRDACAAAGFDTRIVHPFTTKQFRQPADPNSKTDDTDLAAIHRSASNGFALAEATLDEHWRTLQLLVRHRRQLVQKNAALCCQIREYLEAFLPGYAACFDKLWDSNVALTVVRHFASPQAIEQAGKTALRQLLHQQGIRFQERTLDTVLEWARTAAAPELAASTQRRLALALDDERQQRLQAIRLLERDIASYLSKTPYILLLSFPGINVVSAAEFAGEMGPMSNYPGPRAISGRAGMFPSRYQSDRVDRANGPLVRRGNRRLRAAILGIADNLMLCNQHFRLLAGRWRAEGKDPRLAHVKIGARFCRIAYHMVAGQKVFRHPSLRERSYILDKLLAFHTEQQTPIEQTLADLHQAIAQIPAKEYAAEAKPLNQRLEAFRQGRRAKGPQLIADAIAIVLARLGVGLVQSESSEEHGLT